MAEKDANESPDAAAAKLILQKTRDLISECAAGDPDKWFYANRFVFSRLGLDERKTKTEIKRRLLDAGVPCAACGKPFGSRVDVHLHRLDGKRGYNSENCALMHAGCHREYHVEHPEYRGGGADRSRRPEDPQRSAPGEPESEGVIAEPEGILTKLSKRYDDMSFLYWWDIAPNSAAQLGRYEFVEFVRKDSGERCFVAPAVLKKFLVPEHQTTRGAGHWGIKILKGREDELAFEPGPGGRKWLYLPVVWLSDQED